MKLSYLKTLAGLLVAILVLNWLLAHSGGQNNSTTQPIIADLGGKDLTRLVLTQGAETVELERGPSGWALPAKAGFPADNSKVQSLLLKLFDLSSSQAVPFSDKTFSNLGLVDSPLAEGSTKVELGDKSAVLATLIFGNKKQEGSKKEKAKSNSQYVRRVGVDKAFAVGLPVTIAMGVANWIEAVVVNAREVDIVEIDQGGVVSGAFVPEFTLRRSEPIEPDFIFGELKPELTLEEGQELQQSVISQVRSGLENARIQNVFKQEDPLVSGLVFDRQTIFRSIEGLVYRVYTIEKDSKVFGKMVVELDPAQLEKLSKIVAQAKTKLADLDAQLAKFSSKKLEDLKPEERKQKQDLEDKKASIKSLAEKTPTTAEDVAKQNSNFSKWVYEFVGYQGKKFRYVKTDLAKVKIKESNLPQQPAGQPGGLPAELSNS